MHKNLILGSLTANDQKALEPLLKHVELVQGSILYDVGDTVAAVYFPTTALISLVVGLSTGETIEAAMVGRDGIVGGLAALDGKITLSRAIVQLGGQALMCNAEALKRVALQVPHVHSLLVRHEQSVYAQAQQSVACMASHHVEARLCRWMLRARDLAGTDTLPFTQEFLAEMLGVRRTSVTTVAHTLQQAGMIKYARGRIQITSLEGLRDAACECYTTVKLNYERLLGPLPK